MNKKQRIVLIIGALCLIYFLFTSPKISIVKGTYVIPPPYKENIAKIVDVRTAMTRAVAILGATLLITVALKDKKGNRTPSTMDNDPIPNGNCKAGEPKRYTHTKIINFLKNFF